MPDRSLPPFALLEEPVEISLGYKNSRGEFVYYPLAYPIVTVRRLSKRLGVPMIGRKGSLADIDESNLPELIFEGLCDPETAEAPFRDPENEELGRITVEQLLALPSSALAYLSGAFIRAYQQSLPEKKIDELKKALEQLQTASQTITK